MTITDEQAREEFCQRFVAEMLRVVAPRVRFDDGGLITSYAAEVAPTYFDDPSQREEGPEECARADVNYWGE